jgi:hypothetical protein
MQELVTFILLMINLTEKILYQFNYFWRVLFNTRSLLCSLAGGECRDFLLRLIFAILSSPKTSPVLNAEMRSSNSVLSPV